MVGPNKLTKLQSEITGQGYFVGANRRHRRIRLVSAIAEPCGQMKFPDTTLILLMQRQNSDIIGFTRSGHFIGISGIHQVPSGFVTSRIPCLTLSVRPFLLVSRATKLRPIDGKQQTFCRGM